MSLAEFAFTAFVFGHPSASLFEVPLQKFGRKPIMFVRSGIYKATHTASQFVDLDRQPQLLAVKVIGWGVDEKLGREFWIIENSFGKDWGENGYAKIELSEGGHSILLSAFAFAGTPVNPKA
eukprot:symbB.v1.2.007741.t1/scaffold480.1/size253386/3